MGYYKIISIVNNKKRKTMKKKPLLPNLYNLVDELVKFRNTYADYKPKKNATAFCMLEEDFTKTIRGIQKFYPYINYENLLSDIDEKKYLDNTNEQ